MERDQDTRHACHDDHEDAQQCDGGSKIAQVIQIRIRVNGLRNVLLHRLVERAFCRRYLLVQLVCGRVEALQRRTASFNSLFSGNLRCFLARGVEHWKAAFDFLERRDDLLAAKHIGRLHGRIDVFREPFRELLRALEFALRARRRPSSQRDL